MATLETLLATSLSPAQESLIPVTAVSTLDLLRSGTILSASDDKTLFKFNVRVSAYLGSKKPLAKWFGAYLVMTAVNTNWNVLKTNGTKWTQLLLRVLEANDQPLATKEVAIKALSVIFSKTFGKQEFTRDITTPHISPFLKLLFKHAQITEEKVVMSDGKTGEKKSGPEEEFIQLDYEDSDEDMEDGDESAKFFGKGKSSNNSNENTLLSLSEQSELLKVIIPTINKILQQQSTTFRPFAGRYLVLISKVVSLSYTSPSVIEPSLLKQACEGYALLHYSAPKNSEALMWRLAAKHVISHIHETITSVSKPFVDEDTEIFAEMDDSLKSGVNAGVDTPKLSLSPITETFNSQYLTQVFDKLHSLFVLLLAMISTNTKVAVKLPLGAIVNLADRSLTLSQYTTQKPHVEKHRRELFVSSLDLLHFEALNVIHKLVPLTQTMLLCHSETIMHHLEVHLQAPTVLENGNSNNSENDTNSVSSETFRDTTKVQLKALQLATIFFPLFAPISKPRIPVINKMVEEAIKLVTPFRDHSSLKLADAVNNPQLFVSHPSPARLVLVSKFLQCVLVTAPELSMPTRALIDRWFIMAAAGITIGTGINGAGVNGTADSALPFKLQQIISQSLSVSAALPGSSKYSILPMASRLVQNSVLVNNLVHPMLPPKATAVKNINASATLRPRKAKSQEEDEEEEEDGEHEHDDDVLMKQGNKFSGSNKSELFNNSSSSRKRKHGADSNDSQEESGHEEGLTKSKIPKTQKKAGSKNLKNNAASADQEEDLGVAGSSKNGANNAANNTDGPATGRGSVRKNLRSSTDTLTSKPEFRTNSATTDSATTTLGVSEAAIEDIPIEGPTIDVDTEYERSVRARKMGLTRSGRRQLIELQQQEEKQLLQQQQGQQEKQQQSKKVEPAMEVAEGQEASGVLPVGDVSVSVVEDREEDWANTTAAADQVEFEVLVDDKEGPKKLKESAEAKAENNDDDDDDELVIPSIDIDDSDDDDEDE